MSEAKDIQTIETMVIDEFEQEVLAAGIEIVEEEVLPEGIGAEFTPRLSAPSTTDKNWIHYTKGGYNYCIRISGNSCLANCVGYSFGRWREILGKKPKLSLGNAENWWGYNDGYQRGQTPKLGAVACWRKGKAGVASDGAGHVAIVERINADGSVTFSNSSYGGRRFWLCTLKKPYYFGTNYEFQGFIYLPIDFDSEPVQTPTKQITYTVQRGDTLTKIAVKYKTTVAKLVTLNKLTNPNFIYVGQKLVVSGAATIVYVVKKGDTLSKIAAKYQTTVSEIVRKNNIANPNLIQVGQRIMI